MEYKKEPCTIIIIGLNVVVFIVLSIIGRTEDAVFMSEHGAMYVPYFLEQREYYRIITSLFLHFGIVHLGNNMLILFAMGTQLEGLVGKVRFLLIYFISGLGGNVLSLVLSLQTGDYAISAGASGAIFGVVGAMLGIALRNRGRAGAMDSRRIVIMIALSLYLGYASTGVDNAAHLGGLLSGFVMGVLLYRKSHNKRSSFS